MTDAKITGPVDEAKVDPDLARDAEIFPAVLAADGAGSTMDADLLDGQHGSFYQNASNINAGTLGAGYYSARDDLSAEGHLNNASGDIAQNNGTLQSNLNAQMVEGQTLAGLDSRHRPQPFFLVEGTIDWTETIEFELYDLQHYRGSYLDLFVMFNGSTGDNAWHKYYRKELAIYREWYLAPTVVTLEDHYDYVDGTPQWTVEVLTPLKSGDPETYGSVYSVKVRIDSTKQAKYRIFARYFVDPLP